MNTSCRIFLSEQSYESALRKLIALGVPDREINVLQPAPQDERVEAGAAGDSLFFVRGVGRVVASGDRAKALLKAAGTRQSRSSEVGDGSDATLLDRFFVFENALRGGEKVVFVVAAERHQWKRIEETFNECGSKELHRATEDWWAEICEKEKLATATGDAPHTVDDYLFRLGFEASLHPVRRGVPFDDAREALNATHPEACETESFRKGYERGRAHQQAFDDSALCPAGSR